jgi:hypothetical protein
MNETLFHPGSTRLTEADFERFKPFINPQGLDQDQLVWFTSKLADLFSYTWNKGIWTPSQCRKLGELQGVALNVFSPATCEIKRWQRDHYWWEVQNGVTLVVDPAGLPPGKLTGTLPLGTFKYQYLPYFGRPEYSNLPHKEAYSNGEPLDSIGTNEPDFYYYR